MSSDDIVGLPCKQQGNGCLGKMKRGKCGNGGKHDGEEFLVCEDKEWHDSHPDNKSEFIWCKSGKNQIDLYLRKAKAGFEATPAPKAAVAGEKRGAPATLVPDDNNCRDLLIDVNLKLRELVQIQKAQLEFFEQEFKRAKKSSDEEEQDETNGAAQK